MMNLEQLLHRFYLYNDFLLYKQIHIEGLTRAMTLINQRYFHLMRYTNTTELQFLH